MTVFFSLWPNAGPPPEGAELVTLNQTLLVIKATFFDPFQQKDVPLPPHRWVLWHSSEHFAESATSDDDGICTIFRPAAPLPGADEEWELFLLPMSGDTAVESVASFGYVLLDVKEKAWVRVDDWMSGSDDFGYSVSARHLERRSLLLLPLWRSSMKATTGGFVEPLQGAASFSTTGKIKTSELRLQGTPDKPWHIAIDHAWFRSYVSFVYYDYLLRRERPVPQGLVVQGHVTELATGASSCRLDEGAIYVLCPRPKEACSKLRYGFWLPEGTTIQFGAEVMTEKAVSGTPTIATARLMPWYWTPGEIEAWLGPAEASASTRKPWGSLRLADTTPSAPLCFHLDDLEIVEANYDHPPISADNDHLTLMNQRLVIRDQETSSDGELPRSTLRLQRFPLRAEEAVFIRGKGIEERTRIVERDGVIYELLDEISAQGHLAAKPATPIASPGYSKVYFVDARFLDHTFGGTSAALAHVLVYVGCFIDHQSAGTKTAVEAGLARAARRWDQRHAAHPGSESKKDYALVPGGAGAATSVFVKPRFHFGSAQTHTEKRAAIQITPHPGVQGRAYAGPNMMLYEGDWKEKGASGKADIDGVSEPWSTLAHELGHEVGLPDEYLEQIDKKCFGSPPGEVPRINQGAWEAKPFALDTPAMMLQNELPRLRYLWDLAAKLAEADVLKDGAAYRPESRTGSVSLRYEPSSSKGLTFTSPWRPAAQRRVGRSDVLLYPLGQDEGAMGWMFAEPSSAPSARAEGQRVQAIAVVRTRIWFDFDADAGGDRECWKHITDFDAALAQRVAKSPRVFGLHGGAGARFPRVGIYLQPRYTFGRYPDAADPLGTEHKDPVTKAEADLLVSVHGKLAAPVLVSPSEAGGAAPVLRVGPSHLGRWIYRFAITPTSELPAKPDNGALRPDDLAYVAGALYMMLGDPIGVVKDDP